MTRRILIPSLIFLTVLAFALSSASASPRPLQQVRDDASALSPLSGQTLVPGNYCVSCHLGNDPRLATVTDWKGNIAREVNSPCPAATKIHEELYYTERMLLMIDRVQTEAGPLPQKQQAQLDKYTQQYSRLLDEPITSLDAFTAQAQTTRYRLNKIYSSLNQIAEARKQRTVLIYSAVITLVVLGSLVWGLYNTRSIHAGTKKLPGLLKPALFILAILTFFALPVFRVPAAEVEETTAEQQEAQSILDTAERAASTADRAQARAWMLARLGASWNEIDSTQSQAVLEEALTAVQQARENEGALWGQSLSVQETTVGVSIDMEKANLIATDLHAARDWSVPLIAVELNKMDSTRAAELLQDEQASLELQTGIYRDLQLRGVAFARVEIEPSGALPTAEVIHDPLIRAWTLREIAVITKDSSVFEFAVEAARKIEDPVQRARSLREIAVVSGDANLFDEALTALDGVTGAPLAYALSDLAVASEDTSLVNRIDETYADARVAALLHLGEYGTAERLMPLIADPYELARAQSAIAGASGNEAIAMQIDVPLYRDLALRNIVRETGKAALIDSIHSPYYQVQALTALGDYENAMQSTDDLGDAYPLIELAARLANEDPQVALDLVEKMTRESDKAMALNAIAAATNDPLLFEQALGMSLAARVQRDVLAPSEASLDLANLFWQIDHANAQSALRQAYEAALRISIK